MITLGMRNRVLRFFIATEYTGSLAVGLLIGIFIGSLLTIGFQSIIHCIYPTFISIELPGIKTYFIACFYIILLFLVSTFINHEIYVEMELGSSRQIPVSKENMPNR
nr:CPP1-like family protein [Clostridium botulinum]